MNFSLLRLFACLFLTLPLGCATSTYHGEDRSESKQEVAESAKWRDTARVQIEQRSEDVRICGDKFPDAYKSYSKNLVRIEFTVLGEGKVQKIRSIQNTTGSKGIETCLIQAFKNTKFSPIPKHRISMVIQFPFLFTTGPQTIQ